MKALEVVVVVLVNKTFTYLSKDNVLPESLVGKRVKVPFGKRILTGYVIRVCEVENDDKLKKIIDVVDKEVVINKESLLLSEYISRNYIASVGESLSVVVPASMKPPKKNTKQKNQKIEIGKKYVLNSFQQNAYDKISKSLVKDEHKVFLMHGVTASGKTEVYLQLIEKALSLNKQAIVLIPEISLTTQFVEIFKSRFGDAVGVWHSAITNIEKYKLFIKCKKSEIKIMLGARSCIFAPFDNLGLIIIDEEHEHTYKQEQRPSYDAREIAVWRAVYHKGVVVLGSATPSLETYKKALNNEIELLELPKRVDKKSLPVVEILSLKNKMAAGSLLLPQMVLAISQALAKKEQVIVFLNRRGHSPSIICKQCLTIYQCPNCSISMVYHRYPQMLKCHYCGHIQKLPFECPVCRNKKMAVFGTGTQKVEEELQRLFPKAKICRLDGDTATSKEVYKNAYEGLKNDNYDILIGTQMIAKGFDFPKVSLVCVVDADTSLYLPDFKSAEKTFQLITQVAGRCGRGDILGRVIIQTRHPSHYALLYSQKHDFKGFYNQEIILRKKLMYPPFCDIVKIVVKNKDDDKDAIEAQNLLDYLKQKSQSANIPAKFLGPVPAYIAKLNNTFRRNIVIKGSKEDLFEIVDFIDEVKLATGTSISIEYMPTDLI